MIGEQVFFAAAALQRHCNTNRVSVSFVLWAYTLRNADGMSPVGLHLRRQMAANTFPCLFVSVYAVCFCLSLHVYTNMPVCFREGFCTVQENDDKEMSVWVKTVFQFKYIVNRASCIERGEGACEHVLSLPTPICTPKNCFNLVQLSHCRDTVKSYHHTQQTVSTFWSIYFDEEYVSDEIITGNT